MTNDFHLTAPVAFLVFNRPGKTARVFESIRQARPKKLLIVADGPRTPAEMAKCQVVRSLIEKGIDWPCQVLKNYAEHNLGCKNRISSGLDWVFKNVEEAIILEDDCLPDQSFFPFCQELLIRYRNDPHIVHIGGYNINANNPRFHCQTSYYFSNIGLICGWASWRRAWQYYDVNITDWPKIKNSGLLPQILQNPPVVNHYEHILDQYYRQTVDSWDTQWYFARWKYQGLSIVPRTNLVVNIGFDTEGAHHAIDPNDERAHVPVIPMVFPLKHPLEFSINKTADDYTFKHYMDVNHFWQQRWHWWLKSHFPQLYHFLKKQLRR